MSRLTHNPLAHLLAMLIVFACVATAHGAFTDDFQSDVDTSPPDNPPDSPLWNIIDNTPSLVGGSTVEVVSDDTLQLFSSSPGNKMLRLDDNGSSTTSARATNVFGVTVATVSFDFHEPSSGGAGASTVRFVDAAGLRMYQIILDDGAARISGSDSGAGSYAVNVSHAADFIANHSNAAIIYTTPTGTKSLAANEADFWINGVLERANISQSTGNPVADSTALLIGGFGVAGSGGGVQEIYFDNFVGRDFAYVTGTALPEAVPTPSAFAMILVGGLGLMTRRRRRV